MAVWDKFLTERDKQHLALTGAKKEPFGFGSNPAVLVIDDYYGALGEKPMPLLEAVKTWPGSCGMDGWQAIYKTQELLKAARENGIPVIYCTNIPGFPSPWPWGSQKKRARMISQNTAKRHYQIVDEVAPQPGELVINKTTPSAFFGTPLILHLVHERIDTVIACGESTSGCVRASVVDGCSYRLRMGVVEECTFDRHEAPHAMNLFDMNQKYADVVSLSQAASYFKQVAARRAGKVPAGTAGE